WPSSTRETAAVAPDPDRGPRSPGLRRPPGLSPATGRTAARPHDRMAGPCPGRILESSAYWQYRISRGGDDEYQPYRHRAGCAPCRGAVAADRVDQGVLRQAA